DVHRSFVAGVALLPALLLVASRTEGLVAGSREHDNAHRRIELGVLEGFGQLAHGARPEGIAHLRAVDGDPGDTVLLPVEDIQVGHDASAHRGLLMRCPSSPTIPRRKVRTQMMKMTPCATVNHAPSWAR